MLARHRSYWVCQLTGWGGLNVIRFVFKIFEDGYTATLIADPVLHAAVGIAITHAFRTFVHRHSWTRLSLRALMPRVLAAIVVLALLFAGLFVSLIRFFSANIPGENIGSSAYFVARIINGSIYLFLWSALYFGLHWFWNYRQAEIEKWKLEAQAEAARLKALKLQLNPHFLFNSLNSVRALIAQDPSRAQTMTTRLARLLRNTLMAEDDKAVSLQNELSTVRSYLDLEKVRLEDRLRYDITVEEGLDNVIVPHLLIQILVENGIKHGITERSDGGWLTIAVRRVDDMLWVRVVNPGTLDNPGNGVGLQNTRERLRLLFGNTASLRLEDDDDRVKATARMPIRTEPPTSTNGPSSSAEESPPPSANRLGQQQLAL